MPSHERIYQYIDTDKKNSGKIYKHLRCQKTYRKRGYVNQDRRGHIPERMDIDQRPLAANQRQRIEDDEGDTVIGKSHKGVLVTLVDRARNQDTSAQEPSSTARITCLHRDVKDGTSFVYYL